MKAVLLLLFVAVALCSDKFNTALSAQFAKSAQVDFVVMLKNIDYTEMSLKGKAFADLDIDTKAQFIVDTRMSHAKTTQAEILATLSKTTTEFHPIWVINAIHVVKGSKALAEELALRDDVVQIVYDSEYKISPMEVTKDTMEKPTNRVEWNLEWVKSDKLWALNGTGKGIVYGVVDTGANFKHPSLVGAYRGHKAGVFSHDFNWFDPAGRLQEPQDTQDHGSHCTGTILGSTADYKTGAAYDAKWIHCHFGGSFAAITKCFQFLLAPTNRAGGLPNPALRPHISSHSYGGGGQTRSQLEDVVKTNIDAGIMTVVAAHNYARCRAVTDPGIIPSVLTVGALGFKSNVIAPYSSKGPNNAIYNNGLKPEISAPGTNIVSACGTGVCYSTKSGTSMATPLVSGVIGQLWSAYPQLNRNIAETNKILFASALHQTSTECESRQPTPNNVYGHGTISALKAFELAEAKFGRKQ
jgi:subtilisin family serine protease